MAKRRQRSGPKTSKKSRSKASAFENNDLDDEIDAFHNQRDKISLDFNGDDGDTGDEELEQPVFDIESDDESGEDSDEVEEVIRDKGLAAKMARQQKYLRQKFGNGDDDEEDEEEEEGRKDSVWGRKKDMYYRADNIDYEILSSDEDLQDEEAEVIKIQKEKAKSLAMEDFGLEDGNMDEEDSDGEKNTFVGLTPGNKDFSKPSIGGIFEDGIQNFEGIKKDLSSLSKEEQMDVVHSSAPELVGLLSELNEALSQIENLKSVLGKARERKDTSKRKLDHLEVKQVLLLTYCLAISFYLLLKSEGHAIRDHPVIARLVEIKKLLEKLKQVEPNIPVQNDESIAVTTVNSSKQMPEEENNRLEVLGKQGELASLPDVNLQKDDFLKETQNGNSNPKRQDVQMGLHSSEMLKIRANLEAKLIEKGIHSLKKSQAERTRNGTLKAANRNILSPHDFDDEVPLPQSAFARSQKDGVTGSSKSSKLSTLTGAKPNKIKAVSGDDDLPIRDDIGERRRRHELRVLASAGAVGEMENEPEDDQSDSMDSDAQEEDDEPSESEDEIYKTVKRQRTEKLSVKSKLYSRDKTVPTSVETEVDGKRQITSQIEKNRGLTRFRKKINKNPRKKYRSKHEKAVKRRQGQVPKTRKDSGPYGGEATGINIQISHSRRF